MFGNVFGIVWMYVWPGLAAWVAFHRRDGKPQRRIGALGCVSLLSPFFLDGSSFGLTSFAAITSLFYSVRCFDLPLERDDAQLHHFVLHVYLMFDQRKTVRVPFLEAMSIAGSSAVHFLWKGSLVKLLSSVATHAWIHWHQEAPLPGAWPGVFLVAFNAQLYLSLEVLMHSMEIAYALLFHQKHPKIQQQPVLSKSLGEFWGSRWNTIIHF